MRGILVGLNTLGVIKTSLLDYPGKVAAVLFTHGCDLRCPWCHNPGLVTGEPPRDFWPRARVMDFLTKRKQVLQGVAVTGGEPLYHQDLAYLLEEIRNIGHPVKLDTNGTYPRRLEDLPSDLVDFVAMDLKCAPSRYHLQGVPGMTAKVMDSVGVIRRRYPRHQFRTTWVPGINILDEIEEMAKILGAGESLQLTGFRPGNTLDPRWRNSRSPTREELEEVRSRFEVLGIHVSVV